MLGQGPTEITASVSTHADDPGKTNVAVSRGAWSEKGHVIASIVVPSYGRDATLQPLLHRLLDQDFPAFEVVIVHQGEHPFEPANEKVRVINYNLPIGLPMARNAGLDAARGDYIAFIDDDAYPESPNWLMEMVTPFSEDATIGAVGGRIVPPGHPPNRSVRGPRVIGKIVRNSLGMYKIIGNFDLEGRTEADHLPGGNFVVARHALRSLQPPYFNPAFRGTSFREETDFFLRIRKCGFRLVRVQNGTVVHMSLPFGGIRMTRQKANYWKGYGEAILFRNAFWDGNPGSTLKFLAQEALFNWLNGHDPRYQPSKVLGCVMGLLSYRGR